MEQVIKAYVSLERRITEIKYEYRCHLDEHVIWEEIADYVESRAHDEVIMNSGDWLDDVEMEIVENLDHEIYGEITWGLR
jgi:hypothetical protein